MKVFLYFDVYIFLVLMGDGRRILHGVVGVKKDTFFRNNDRKIQIQTAAGRGSNQMLLLLKVFWGDVEIISVVK